MKVSLLQCLFIISWVLLTTGLTATGYYVRLVDANTQPRGSALLTIDGTTFTYYLLLPHLSPQAPTALTVQHTPHTLSINPFITSGISACSLQISVSRELVLDNNDLTPLHDLARADALRMVLAGGDCDAIIPLFISEGTLELPLTTAALLARGGLTIALPAASLTAYLPASQVRYAGVIRDTSGTPLSELNIQFWRPNGTHWQNRTTITGPDGKWELTLPASSWAIAPRPADLLARGYFCRPGALPGDFTGCLDAVESTTNPGEFRIVPCPPGSITNPPPNLWGDWPIEWQPTPIDIGQINLITVPTRPTLSVTPPTASGTAISIAFDTQAGLPQTLTRQWQIMKSTDLMTWTPIQLVALAGTSPILLTDPERTSTCYYRAVSAPDLIASP